MKKKLLKTIYNFGGFAPFHWATRGSLRVLMYHRFSLEADEYKTSADEFAAHLAYLKKHCRVLSLTAAIEDLKNEKPLPPNAVVITIDDGYADAGDIAFPLLREYETPAALYAVTDFLDGKCWLWTDLARYVLTNTKAEKIAVEFGGNDKIETRLGDGNHCLQTANRINARLKKLPDEEKDAKIEEIAEDLKVRIPAAPVGEFAPVSWEQARTMEAGGLQIESHTVSHPILTNIGATRLAYELRTSKTRLEEKLEKEIKHFCYPNGDFNETIAEAAKKAGYASAVTTAYGFNEPDVNRFKLNRIDAPPSIESFAQSASGFDVLRRKIKK